MTAALVDGDVITYTAGFGAERTIYALYVGDRTREQGTKPVLSSTHKKDIDEYIEREGVEEYELVRTGDEDPLAYALQKAKLMLEKVVAHTGADEIKVFLTDSDSNFRNDIATFRKYKGNRDSARKPVWYHNIREYLVKYWGAEIVEGQEADDKMGILQCSTPENTIICTTDKDLRQIPGLHYHLVKETTTTVSAEEGIKTFYLQAMTGDSGDNIIGAPGIGKVGAEKLYNPDSPWRAVLAAYKKGLKSSRCPDDLHVSRGGVRYKHWRTGHEIEKTVEEFALEQAQLVYIRKKEGEIWTPQMSV